MKLELKALTRLIGIIIILGVAIVVIVFGRSNSVFAQITDEGWPDPINLSQSGGVTNPSFVIDSGGITHVIWVDNFSLVYNFSRDDEFPGFVYTRNEAGEWTQPEAVRFPFDSYQPRLFADNNGQIHAFWVDEESVLRYSRVPGSLIKNPANWTITQQLASSALDLDVVVDEDGNIHLVYIRQQETIEFPAGVYYRSSSDGGNSWSNGQSLYLSPYFRTLTEENSNINITSVKTAGVTWLYVVWDNQPRNQVFFARSPDEGQNWEAPEVLAGPEVTDNLETPSDIQIGANNNEVLITWQSTIVGGNCDQIFIWSSNNGENWSDPQVILENVTGCLDESQFFNVDGKLHLLEARIQQQIYLLAWNGEQWSEPQIQSELESFEDPESLNQIDIGCHQLNIANGSTLFFVGCDTSGVGDIWSSWRTLGSIEEWFPPASVWSSAVSVVVGNIEIAKPVLVADSEKRFHVFWISDGDNPLGTGAAIFYARWDGERWTQPVTILNSPDRISGRWSVTIDGRGRLLVVWSGGVSGEMYFSWANADRAFSLEEWAEPQVLPSLGFTFGASDILVDDLGTIYVTVAIPINEKRGIYLMQSGDGGTTWSQPVQAVDAAAMGWNVVDRPLLARTADGTLHVVWSRLSYSSPDRSIGLFYARSIDGGENWSEPVDVSGGVGNVEEIVWSRVFAVGERIVHLIWEADVAGRRLLVHQQSFDGGLTWSQVSSPQSTSEISEPVGISIDGASQLHMVRLQHDGITGNPALHHWRWDGNRWIDEEVSELGIEDLSEGTTVAAAVASKNELGVVFASSPETGSQERVSELYFTTRTLDLPQDLPTPLPPLTPTPIPTPFVEVTLEPTPTPTLVFFEDNALNDSQPSNLFGLDSDLVGPVIGVILAGVIVLGSFLVRITRRRE